MKKKGEKVWKEKASEEDALTTADDYQCSGDLEMDFQEICSLLGIKEIPAVTSQPRASFTPTTDRGSMERSQSQMGAGRETTMWCPKSRLQVELESEDPQSVNNVKVFGWKVDELMARVLNKILPALSNLKNLHLWQAGLNVQTLISLKNTISLCSNLRTVVLEGNPLPEQNYHLLISEDSMLTHVSLRNNQISEEGARLIGSALSTAHSANKKLLSLNLAFNAIGNAGAAHIAQGLRLNRSLLSLSLANNHIGDTGASHLAEVLGPFALTHDEVVERRRLLLRRDQSPPQAEPKWEGPLSISSSSSLETNISKSTKSASKKKAEPRLEGPLSISSSSSLETNISKSTKSASKKKDISRKDEKPALSQTGVAAGKKEEPKPAKKLSDTKGPRIKVGKPGGKEKRTSLLDQEEKTNAGQNKVFGASVVSVFAELSETVSPLLEAGVQHTGGQVILPGNTALISLNLAGNHLSERSLHLFLSSLGAQSLGAQTEGRGLLHLRLNRNRFPPECEYILKIQDIMALRDPLNKTASAPGDEEEGQAA